MTGGEATAALAVVRRRASRRQEWHEQERFVAMMEEYLDPATTYFTSLENKPRTLWSGIFQKRRGIKSGVSDVMVIQQQVGKKLVVFVELKSRAGVASKNQKQFRLEVLVADCQWWMARSANAALLALQLSGVVFRRLWTSPQLAPWEGPFADPNRRLPQAPEVAAQRREARQRARERQRARKNADITGLRESTLQSPRTGAAP